MDLRAALEQLTRDIWVKGWWDDYAANVQVHVIDLAWLETRAQSLRDFSLSVMHGPLQTREYAEAIMKAADPHVPDELISQWADFRMKRQEVLDQLEYTTILDEAVFQRFFGGPNVMRGQLAHLLSLSERSNITIRVLPFAASPLVGPESAFTLLTMAAPFPVMTQVTSDVGTVYVEMPKAARFETAYSRLQRHALDVEDSRVFIKTRMEQIA